LDRRGHPKDYDAAAGPREFARLARAVDGARLRVVIAATYPLAQAARTHRRLERGHVVGRIALRMLALSSHTCTIGSMARLSVSTTTS
jgi:NADPH:quinone reductase-like Zn-dependent oxidoreductase